MTTPAELTAIIDQYKGHEWKLRRVIGSPELIELFDKGVVGTDLGLPSKPFELNCLWFSRASRVGSETWELRRATGTPYALVAVASDDLTPIEVEELLCTTELEMLDASGPKPDSGNQN
jgi:hypothetical protein